MKAIARKLGVTLLVGACLFMIMQGSLSHSSSPKQEKFTHSLHEPLDMDPTIYLRGVTVPDKVNLDFTKVNVDQPGTYDVIVNQPGATYTFQIIVS